MGKSVAVIPVKKVSTRLPGKNLLPFGNESLLQRKINQLKAVDKIDQIVVSTNWREAGEQAMALGVEVDWRPESLANESRPLGDFFEHICDKYISYKTLVWSCCTSPLFDSNWMAKAVDTYFAVVPEKNDSLIVTTEFKHYLMDANGPVNYQLGDAGHVNSQDLPVLEVFTNGVVIAPIRDVRNWRYNYGTNAYRLRVPQDVAIDIDTKADYLAALAWSQV